MTISSLNTEFAPIMVDVETLGLSPNENPITQLAMVSFDPETFEVLDEFEMFLPLPEQLAAGLKADAATMEWWSKQSLKVQEHIAEGLKNAMPISPSLCKAYDWVNLQVSNRSQKVDNKNVKSLFWAKPAGFDFPFVDGLFRRHKEISPFHYQQVVDMKSYAVSQAQTAYRVLFDKYLPHGAACDIYWLYNDHAKKNNIDKGEDAHNATADCKYQIEWLKWSTEHLIPAVKYFKTNGEVKGYLRTL